MEVIWQGETEYLTLTKGKAYKVIDVEKVGTE